MLDREIQVRKLKWRSRRSLLELDLYFEKFIQSKVFKNLSLSELKLYAQILEMDDNELLLLLQGRNILELENLQQIIELIRNSS